ncbi:MAG: virulence factor SrfB [Kiritimatiellaeota bacterium]|nr:virulence factor SrfB [Kiritimatiellota bacterium]
MATRKTLDDYIRGNKAVKMMLAMDLGNSRTAIALYDRIGGDDGDPVVHTDIPLVWGASEATEIKTIFAPFDSRISTVAPDANSPSFVRIGAQAWQNERGFKSVDKHGEHTLSSPKRYFFDAKPSRRGWLCREQSNGTVVPLAGVFPSALAQRYGFENTPDLPRAAMLGAMVAEFYLQAHRHANKSPAFKKKTKDPRPRFISHICLTYPTTFTEDEKKRYLLQIDKALRVLFACCTEFKDAPFVEVVAGIDEGTAVLAYHADRALAKFGSATAWLTTAGWVGINGYASRMAVMDIGGGTTDVAVVHLTGGRLSSVDMQLLYLEGENRAGDDFIAEFVKRWLFERIVNTLCEKKTGVDLKHIKDAYNKQVSEHPEAIRVLCGFACKAIEKIGNPPVTPVADPKRTRNNSGSTITFKLDKEKREILNNVFFEDGSNGIDDDLNQIEIPFEQKDATFCDDLAAEVFNPIITRMARIIAAFGCDRLLLSGKTCEFSVVKRLVYGTVALPSFCIIPASELMDGRDVKYATVLGGGILGLKKIGAKNALTSIDFSIGEAMRTQFVWGFDNNITKANLRISENIGNKLTPNGDGLAAIPYEGRDVYVIRQCYDRNSVVCVSHRISHRSEGRPVESSVILTIRINSDGRVQIVNAQGSYTDGNPVTIGDFDCVHFSQTDTKHWMDDGRILD